MTTGSPEFDASRASADDGTTFATAPWLPRGSTGLGARVTHSARQKAASLLGVLVRFATGVPRVFGH